LDEPALDLPADFSCEEGALSVFVALGLEDFEPLGSFLIFTKTNKTIKTSRKVPQGGQTLKNLA